MYHWSPRGSLLFHSSLFQYFLLSSVFRILIIMESWLGFLWVYPVCDSLSFLNLEVCVFCQICEVSGHYFFKYFFSPIFSPFPDFDNTNVNFFVTVHCPWSSVHYFVSLLSLCCSQWVISTDLSSSSLILSSVICDLLLSHHRKFLFLNSVIIFFSSIIILSLYFRLLYWDI